MKVAEIHGLPPRCVALFGLCVGTAAEDVTNQVKPRLPQPAVLFRERYGEAGEADLRAVYDADMTAFSERHGMGTQSWSARVIGRMGTVGAMKGREKLSEILAALGFPLR